MYIYTISKATNQEKTTFKTLNCGELFTFDNMSYMKVTGAEPNVNALALQIGELMYFEDDDEVYPITQIHMKGHLTHG